MAIPLHALAAQVSAKLIGDGALICTGANPPGQATAGEITLLDTPRHVRNLDQTQALAVVTTAELVNCELIQLVVSDAHEAFAKIVRHFRPPIGGIEPLTGIHPTAQIHSTAQVHPSATIGAEVVIGAGTRVMPGVVILPRCRIGNDCLLHAGVTLYEYTVLGDRVVLHSHCVIGANGFGYRQQQGRHVPSAQLGYVEIESDVEAGAMVTIDRGTYGATRIGAGTKIDNQVQVAHNCIIGRHNLLCSQVGIAGSCRTGDYVVLAGQVGLKDHVVLGDRAMVAAQSGVMDDLAGDETYLGSPAVPLKECMQILATERRLPEMRRAIKSLQRAVERLEQSLAGAAESTSTTNDQQRAA